jgi:alkylhydroperoxidase/carboxymuconolactone decarboxylase family protein YurZ
MQTLSDLLTSGELSHLRSGYDAHAVLELKVRATSAGHPAHAPWTLAIRDTFFGDSGLSGRERELCIIALLSFRAPDISLATHVYAGLMEGLSVAEICSAIGLGGCYGGLPAYTESMGTVRRTLTVLKQLALDPDPTGPKALLALVTAFTGQTPQLP